MAPSITVAFTVGCSSPSRMRGSFSHQRQPRRREISASRTATSAWCAAAVASANFVFLGFDTPVDLDDRLELTPLERAVAQLAAHEQALRRLRYGSFRGVVKDGKLVGIVSRANLLQAIATIGKTIKPAVTVDDATLREKVIAQLDRQPLAWRSRDSGIVGDGRFRIGEESGPGRG